MIKFFRGRIQKYIAATLLISFITQGLMPLKSYALTSGPLAPEVSSFEPSGTSDMVDLFTGDFNYNIPLFELPGPNGGYPFNLAYHAGVAMDQEASWVGLGWNVNPGAINRDMRGLPDEFDGTDKVHTYMDLKDNWTAGLRFMVNYEPFGADTKKTFGLSIGGGMSMFYNSYKGVGMSIEAGLSGSFHKSGSKIGGSLGLNLSMNSQNGASLDPHLGLNATTRQKDDDTHGISASLGMSFNSQRGLGDLSLNVKSTLKSSDEKMAKYGSTTRVENKEEKTFTDINSYGSSAGATSSIGFNASAFTPSVRLPMVGGNLNITVNIGPKAYYQYITYTIGGFFSMQTLAEKKKDVSHSAYGYLNYEKDIDRTGMLDFNREKDGPIRKQNTHIPSPNLTYDIYNIQGQGVGGMFRPYRSDIGSVYDESEASYIGGGGGGLDIGVGGLAKIGGDISLNFTEDESGFGEDGGASWGSEDIAFGQAPSDQKDYEASYYVVHGEKVTEPNDYYYKNMGGEDAVRVSLGGIGSMGGDWVNNANVVMPHQKHRANVSYPGGVTSSRKQRKSNVTAFKNEEISYLHEFDIKYYSILPSLSATCEPTSSTPTSLTELESGYNNINTSGTNLSRTCPPLKDHHTGGFSVLDDHGSTYVYGLPVYNTKHVDMQFAVDGGGHNSWEDFPLSSQFSDYRSFQPLDNSDNYLKRTGIDPFVASHLLTSIEGVDYVDVDQNGPSDNDFGYWVKFNYVKTADTDHPYKWRAPFFGANFAKNLYSIVDDDQASYTYGEREAFYLATAETKTHIAVFSISPRRDALGAAAEYQTAVGSSNPKSYKLDKVSLYIKSEYFNSDGTVNTTAIPITTTHFEYTYELCKGVDNYDGSVAHQMQSSGTFTSPAGGPYTYSPSSSLPTALSGGKLTLRKVWTTYERNANGQLSPYVFNYNGLNPDYSRHDQDRWGGYKNYGTGKHKYDHPYVDQTDPNVDSYAGAWNLTDINTPTGSTINVAYESDDYGYVQNKVATQMFKIESFGYGDLTSSSNLEERGKLYDKNNYSSDKNKVFFKLIKPTSDQDELKKYFDDLYIDPTLNSKQVYYKTRIQMQKKDTKFKEYVSGYAALTTTDDATHGYNKSYGFAGNTVSGGLYEYGWILLDETKLNGKTFPGNPISLAAWQFFRTSLPQLVNEPGSISGTPGTNSASIAAKIKSLLYMFTSVADLFTNYYKASMRKGWAQYVSNGTDDDDRDLDNSFIRLCNPYKNKKGGGHRVKKLTIKDNWTADNRLSEQNQSEYGAVYDYTTKDQDGSLISSGVAQYEPITGGDEIALRHADHYSENVKIKGGNNYYFEFPVDESYFPAAVVGYSRVGVRSLASDRYVTPNSIAGDALKSGASTTGQVDYEFYTAKDFPVITEYTELKEDQSRFSHNYQVPIPFLGVVQDQKLTISQGFKIELNDMHGKQKRISYYGAAYDANATSNKQKIDFSKPVSSVQYNYMSHVVSYDGNSVSKLDNTVPVLYSDGSRDTKEMGVEYEVFHDTRYSRSLSINGGVNIQAEVSLFGFVPLPLFFPWPNAGFSETILRTIATNKIIHRSGILASTVATDGNSTVYTENLLYDQLTGQALLTKVNNNFDKPVYKNEIPAYWQYDNMGPAYRNIGYVTDQKTVNSSNTSTATITISADDLPFFTNGDHILITTTGSASGGDLAIVQKVNNAGTGFGSQPSIVVTSIDGSNLSNRTNATLKIMRSGRTNQINASAGEITALEDPTLDLNAPEYDKIDPTITLSGTTDVQTPVFDVCFNNIFQMWNDIFHNFPSHDPDDLSIAQVPSGLCTGFPNPYIGDCHHNILLRYGNRTCAEAVPYTREYVMCGTQKIYKDADPDAFYQCLYSGTLHTRDGDFPLIGGVSLEDARKDLSNAACCQLQIFDASGNEISMSNIGRFILPAFYPTSSLPASTITTPNGTGTFVGQVKYYPLNGSMVPLIANIYSVANGDACSVYSPQTVYTPTMNYSQCDAIRISIVNNVLNANATVYSDVWPQTFNDASLENTTATIPGFREIEKTNPYANGEKGIWRAEKTYTYVDQRVQSSPTVNIASDGIFNILRKFSWINPLAITQAEGMKKWRLTNTITNYNNSSNEQENKNILDIYSSALFGYHENLTTAVAANAKQTEIGYEGFEEKYDPGTGNSFTQFYNSTGNLDFVEKLEGSTSSPRFFRVFDVTKAKGNQINVRVKDLSDWPSISSADIIIKGFAAPEGGIGAESIYKYAASWSVPTLTTSSPQDANGDFILTLGSGLPGFNDNANRCWAGQLYIVIPKDYDDQTRSNFAYSSAYAHTGGHSLAINGSSVIEFPQRLLDLNKKGTYEVSLWVSVPDAKTYDYTLANVHPVIKVYNSAGALVQPPVTLNPTGEIIEGWQKVEGSFDIPLGGGNISITLSGATYNSILKTAYYDDIRIYPKDGSIQTFVFNPLNLKLAAKLDENNYATFYYYNDQGELFLIKRETNKGRVTVQEVRKHITESN